LAVLESDTKALAKRFGAEAKQAPAQLEGVGSVCACAGSTQQSSSKVQPERIQLFLSVVNFTTVTNRPSGG
jgi:hypothetical protein